MSWIADVLLWLSTLPALKDDPTLAVSYDYVALVQTATGDHKIVAVEVKSLQAQATLAAYHAEAGQHLRVGQRLYSCSYDDDEFNALVPKQFRRQCLHQAALLGATEYFLAFATLCVEVFFGARGTVALS